METQNLSAADVVNAEIVSQNSDVNLTVQAAPVTPDTPMSTIPSATPIDAGACMGIVLPEQKEESKPIQQPRRIPSEARRQKYTKEEYEKRKAFIAEMIARRSAKFKAAGYSDEVIAALCKYVSANRGYDENGRHQGDFLTYLLCKFVHYCKEARNFTTNVKDQLADDLNEIVSAINAGATEAEAFKIFKAQLRNRDAVTFINGRMNALVHNYGEFRYMAEGVLYLLLTFPNALNFCEHVNTPEATEQPKSEGTTEPKQENKPKQRQKQHAPTGVKRGARPKLKGLNVGSFDALNFANGKLVIDNAHAVEDAKKVVEVLAPDAVGDKTPEEIPGK